MTNAPVRVLLATASSVAIICAQGPLSPALANFTVAAAASVVSGQVRNPATSGNLAGATVEIEELGLEATTGPDGRFRFPNVPAGQYTLSASLLGGGVSSTTVTVPETGEVSVRLEVSADEVIVTGTRGALASARGQERAADQFKSVVTADDIGQFADQNVAESLQRLPGVSIRRSEGEGQQVAVRGLSGSFVTVTVDGARLGTRDTGTRSVNLDILSSDLLQGIEVTKSLTPDLDADSIGGAVNLRSISAFDRGKNSFSVRAEGAYQEKSEDFNPKVAGDFTRLFDVGGGSFGIAGGISWSRRKALFDDLRVDNGLREVTVIDDPALGNNDGVGGDDSATITLPEAILSPNAIDQRADPAIRTRLSSNLALEWRPNDNHELFTRLTYAKFKDDDIRQREVFNLTPGVGREIISLTPTSGRIADVDFEKRFRFTDQVDDLYGVSAGGESRFGGVWTVNYQFDYSLNDSKTPSFEARFRERDVILDYSNLAIDGVDFQVLPNPAAGGANPNNPSNFQLRFLTQYDFFVEDEITAFKSDLQRDFSFNGRPALLKIGGKWQDRSKTVDVTRGRIGSATPVNLSAFPLQDGVPNSDLSFLFTPELGPLEEFTRDLAVNGVPQPSVGDAIVSVARDYTTVEKVYAGYAMAQFNTTEKVQMTVGFRVESTVWDTVGSVSNQINFDEGVTEALQDALQAGVDGGTAAFTQAQLDAYLAPRLDENGDPLEEGVVSAISRAERVTYFDFFPHVHFRWEPTEKIVGRASFTEAIQRPNFNEASAIGQLTFSEETEETDVPGILNSLAAADALLLFENQAGTDAEPFRVPSLRPLRAKQLDGSLSFYPSNDIFFQVAVFYKSIKDFIVPVTFAGAEVADVGLTPGDGTLNGGFDFATTFVNGDNASLVGVELAYTQNYRFLPGLLSGLYFAGNVTLSDSTARLRNADREFSLPDQADIVGNLSVGWENKDFSLRWSGNYSSERLLQLNAGFLSNGLSRDDGDLFERSRWSMDLNARWNVTNGIQAYFDAVNINGARDQRFFLAPAVGGIFNQIEDYGATYQVGVRARF